MCSRAHGPDDIDGVLPVTQSADQIRRFYDRIAGVYDLLSERTERPVREAGIEALSARRGDRILEIGTGTGNALASLARVVGPDGRVCGLDCSENMLRHAARRLRKDGVESLVSLCRGDALALPFLGGAFDDIVMSFTLELFDTPIIPQVLQECARALRPGGRLLVIGLSKEGPRSAAISTFEWIHEHLPSLLDCRPIYVRRAVEAAGFDIEVARTQHLWVPVELVVGRRRAGADRRCSMPGRAQDQSASQREQHTTDDVTGGGVDVVQDQASPQPTESSSQ